jgi:hypothetical protein
MQHCGSFGVSAIQMLTQPNMTRQDARRQRFGVSTAVGLIGDVSHDGCRQFVGEAELRVNAFPKRTLEGIVTLAGNWDESPCRKSVPSDGQMLNRVRLS